MREDNERQQRLLSANLQATPQSQNEVFMQHEITRLTTENLELVDRNDVLNDSVRKLKRQLKLLMRKIKEVGLEVDESFNDIVKADEAGDAGRPGRGLPCIKKKERNYEGMFSFRSGDEAAIMKHLVIGEFPF